MKFRFLKKKTRAYLKSNETVRSSGPYSDAVSFGLIFTVEDRRKHDQIKTVIRKLEQDGKQVKALAFLPPHQENYEFFFDFFTYREISFWGNITASSAIKFADSPFDFLLYLDDKPNDLILNIIAKSKAKCRIGKFGPDAELYFEMMIENHGDTLEFIDELFRYTRSLR